MLLRALGFAVVFAVATATVSAQWLSHRTPGTPRLPDGRPNLSAPAPRTADGRPDLSGVWAAERNRPPGPVGAGFVGNRHAGSIAIDLPKGAPLTDWGRKAFEARRAARWLEIQTEKCLPSAIPPDMLRPQLPFKVIQKPAVVVILIEEASRASVRQGQVECIDAVIAAATLDGRTCLQVDSAPRLAA